MKVSIDNISDGTLQSYTLTKNVKNRIVTESIENTFVISDKEDFVYLLESMLKGDDKDTGTITVECANQTITKNIYLKHGEGKFDLKNCIAEKKLILENPFDCTVNEEINIFDFLANDTKTILGTLDVDNYSNSTLYAIGTESEPITLALLLGVIGGYPDKTAQGYFPEYILLDAVPEYITFNEPGQGDFEQYTGHRISIYVRYVRLRDSIQHTSEWLPIPSSSDFYYTNIPAIEYGAPFGSVFAIREIGGTVYYEQKIFEAGKRGTYTSIPISNTVLINPIIEDIFLCTGYLLVSNFFGINPDGSNPSNSYYEYADSYCKNIKIVQSYDIIRESATEDSFGKSGKIKVKEFLDLLVLFNVHALVDQDSNVLRLEHISYFSSKGVDFISSGIDYELSPMEANVERIDAEIFEYALPTPTENFHKTKIEYSRPDIYSEPNEKIYKMQRFLSDVFGTLNNKDYENENEYKKAFYLLSTQNDAIIALNIPFAMKTIVTRLHGLQRPLKSAKIENESVLFESFSAGLSGTVKFFGSLLQWEKMFPFYLIKIKQGTFLVNEVTYSDDGTITLKISK